MKKLIPFLLIIVGCNSPKPDVHIRGVTIGGCLSSDTVILMPAYVENQKRRRYVGMGCWREGGYAQDTTWYIGKAADSFWKANHEMK